MASTSNFLNDGTDLGAALSEFLEPTRAGLSQTAYNTFKNDTNGLETYFLRKDHVLAAWRSQDKVASCGFLDDGVDLAEATTGVFQAKGYAPGTGVRIAYTSGTTTISPSTLKNVSGADFLDYDPKSFNAFVCGGGGPGGTTDGTATNGGAGGGGGGAAVLFSAQWPDEGNIDITIDVASSTAAGSDGDYSEIRFVSGITYRTRAGGGSKGADNSGATGGAGGNGGTITDTWGAAVSSQIWKVSTAGEPGGAGGNGGGTNNGTAGDASVDANCPFKYDLLGDGTENGGKGFEYIDKASATLDNITISYWSGGSGGAYHDSGYPDYDLAGGGGGGGAGYTNNQTGTGADGNGNNAGANSGAGGGGGQGSQSQAGGDGGSGHITLFY